MPGARLPLQKIFRFFYPSRFFRTFSIGSSALALSVGTAAGPLACGTTGTTLTVAPITGITLRAETLTAGYGCGVKNGQVFRYLAVVLGANPDDAIVADSSLKRRDELLAASLYDCFADGQFIDLPVSGGSSDYVLKAYLYDSAAYAAAGGDARFNGIANRLGALRASVVADGGADVRTAIQAELAAIPTTHPTFTTTCSGAQFPDVQSLAVCEPLTAGKLDPKP